MIVIYIYNNNNLTVLDSFLAYVTCGKGNLHFYDSNLYDVYKFINRLREQYPNIKNLYAYTSGYALYNYLNFNWIYSIKLDGISIAPKDTNDWMSLKNILKNEVCSRVLSSMKSNRLMVFDTQKTNFKEFLKDIDLSMFTILGRKWDKKFSVPDNEIFRKLPVLFD